MFTAKKHVLIIMLCFLTTLLPLHYLWAQEKLKKVPIDQQKSEDKKKPVPTFTIKGTIVEISPDKKTSEQQKSETKQEQVLKENQPQIFLESTNYDVGEIWEGDEIVHAFTIKNTGTAQLNIKKVRAG